MRKILSILSILTIIFLFGSFANSQENEIEKSVLSFEEKHEDKDYIYLLNEKEVILNKDHTYSTRVHKKVNIQQEDGKSWGEITVYYNQAREEIIEMEAFSITPDGKTHPFTKAQDFSVYEDLMYSDARKKILTIPEVNIGSVIELKTLKKSKGQVIPDSYWEECYLETYDPIKRFKVKYVFPKTARIRYKEFNVSRKPVIKEDGDTITYQWDLEDVYDDPEDEDYPPLPTVENTRNVSEFSTLNDWKEVSAWAFEAVNKNLKVTPEIQEATKKIFEGKKTLKEKVRAAIEYLRDNFRYVSMSFGDNTYEPHPTDEVFANKYGDCKDISLLLMAMLKTAGIKSNLVLSNEETDITDPRHDLPMLELFNHAFVLIDNPNGDNFYVDPLLKGYDIGEFSSNYQGAYTFIITNDGGKFDRFPIFDEKIAYSEENTTVAINEDGSALIELESALSLDDSDWLRQTYKNMNNEEKETFMQSLLGQLVSGGELLAQEMRGLNDRYGRISYYIKMKKFDEYPIISDLIIIDVDGFERDGDFTKKERKDPIFERVNSLEKENYIYTFPENFQVMHLPESIDLNIEFFEFTRNLSQDGNEITIKDSSRKKRMTLGIDKYQQVKEFFDDLPAKSKQRIVLKRSELVKQKQIHKEEARLRRFK